MGREKKGSTFGIMNRLDLIALFITLVPLMWTRKDLSFVVLV